MIRCVFLILLLIGLACQIAQAGPDGRVRVIDGDTIWVGSKKLRLFGIDAPEKDQTCLTSRGEEWPCGQWVTKEFVAKYQNHMAKCEAIDTDRYGRIVGRCEIDGADVAESLVSAGLAFAYRRYSSDYVAAEKKAMMAKIGLHRGRTVKPADYRKSKIRGRVPPDPKCPIKGNIGRDGRRIYHVPGQRDYDKTGINLQKGERWFCSTRDAISAGWKAAKR